MSLKRLPKPGIETLAALIGTAFSAMLLVVTALNVGPLWRDEINTLNVAVVPSLGEVWHKLQFDSFPLLWPLLVRGSGMLGLADSDMGIRILGLGIGLFFLSSLWFCQGWVGGRTPTLSIALLGALPAFIFVMGANRAYGLAGCLLVLSFGTIWRILECPTKSRILSAGLICLLFAQCLYYDVIFLGAMLSAAVLVATRRKQWKIVCAIASIGLVAGASLSIYLPITHRSSEYQSFIGAPSFDSATLWDGLGNALAANTSAHPSSAKDGQVWIWTGLLLTGIIVAIATQRTHLRQAPNQEAILRNDNEERSDRGLFCVVTLVFAIIGYTAFLLRLKFFMQPWYYFDILILCAVCLDGILTVNWPAFRPWGFARVALLVLTMGTNAGPAWTEAHTRRSNLDLVAAFLGQNASAGDMIVVQDAWEGITFKRYYRGHAQWVTIPPIDSHDVHRIDQVMEKMTKPATMTPVLAAITNALSSGQKVWLVGRIPIKRWRDAPPGLTPPPPPLPSEMPTQWWYGSYLLWWNQQATTLLLDHAQEKTDETITVPGPVSHFENVSVVRFIGYKRDFE